MNELKIPEQTEKFVVGIIEQAQGFIVNTDDDLRISADVLKKIKEAEKEVENQRVFFTKPLNEQLKKINEKFKVFSEPLKQAEQIIKEKVVAYVQKREEERKKEQARLRREETLRAKERGETIPDEFRAEIPEFDKTTEGEIGAITTRKRWTYEIIDFSKVPDKYKEIDAVKVNQAIRAGVRQIEGLKIYEKEEVAIK